MKKMALLGYHKIGDHPPEGWPTWSYVTENIFKEQLQYLHENNWQVISIETFLKGLDDADVLPEKSALITFDDGYRSNLSVALPVLQQFDCPAVLFVPTSFVGGYNSFDADIFYEPVEPICTWEELRELEHRGVSVQSHGKRHAHFSKLSADEQRAEVVQSKVILEEQLGKEVDFFSFPYGDEGQDAQHTTGILAEAGYKAACLYGGRPLEVPIVQAYRLERVPVGPDTDMRSALGD